MDKKLLDKFSKRFAEDKQSQGVKNAIASVGFEKASFNNNVLRKHNFVFSDETKRGDITNQKSSGRCWMFASLNVARVSVMEKLNMKTFEFSQNYTFFWDKLEKANYFLENILHTLDEDIDSRLMKHLLAAPLQDGGQWDMFKEILKKYGAVPKSVMPETFHSSNSHMLDTIMTTRLREDACRIRQQYKEGKKEKALRAEKDDMLYEIYNILTKALGEVPTKFDFSYRDEDEKFHRIEGITPQEFFNKYVGWNLDDKISLINAPTEDKPYGKAYTVQYLGTIYEADPVRYVNVPMEDLKKAAIRSIQDGHPVWFGCDVGQRLGRKEGIMDLETYDFEDTLGFTPGMTKAERLDYSESVLTHAMVLVGVDLDKKGHPLKWKVENSWGDENGDKGIYSMSDAWMNEFTYQIMVDRKYVDKKWLKAYDGEVTELKPWDPIGSLAKNN
ncbi:aminopeptidase C [Levyella massiliensis]|uniref:aminopeptidase C n=1 Tax=Levyella massiliensis TaxID=938289 RepID=UPI003EBE9B1B